MKWQVALKSGNNSYGESPKMCFSGAYNVVEENGILYLHIFYEEELRLTLLCYKNPYFIAQGILGVPNVEFAIETINNLHERGLIEGKDFTITIKGIFYSNEYLRNHPGIEEI